MSSGNPPAPALWRHCIQFRLRTVLWTVLVVALALAWWTDRARFAQRLRESESLRRALRVARKEDPHVHWNFYFEGTGWAADHATVPPLTEHLTSESHGPWAQPEVNVLLSDAMKTTKTYDANVARGLAFLSRGTAATIDFPSLESWSAPHAEPKEDGSIARLIELLTNNDAKTRAQAACTLGKIGPAARPAVPDLIRGLSDAEHDVRWHAAYALGRIGPEARAAVAALTALMNDDGSTLPAFAAQVLRRINPSASVVPRLVELLDHSRPATRRRAALALGEIGQDIGFSAQAKLTSLLTDEDSQVRQAAVTAVGQALPTSEAISALVPAFENEQDKEVRRHAANVLVELDEKRQAPSAAGR